MFKRCSGCSAVWPSRDAFLGDGAIKLVGYQVQMGRLETGYFLFNHVHKGCGSTISIAAGEFFDLYQGTVFRTSKFGGVECGGHCLHAQDLDACPAECECAFVREVLQIVRKRMKQTAA